MNIFKYIIEKKIFYLILGTIFSIISVGRFNFPLLIFIWPYCFLVYLHQNEKKLIPLILVSICLIFSNMIRWMGNYEDNILFGFLEGAYLSSINIIPYIIDDIIYNKISKWASVFVFPLLVAFTEYIFIFMPYANHNVYAYALRNNLEIIQICSLFGAFFLSFIIALFASIVDYSHNVYKKEKKISKFVYWYVIIILLISCFGSIRLLIPEKEERYNIAAALGAFPSLYLEGKVTAYSKELYLEYLDYIQKTIIKANKSEAKLILYAEEAFYIEEADKQDIINKTVKLAEQYNIFVALPILVKYDNYFKNEAILISDKGTILYNYQKKNLIPIMESEFINDMTEYKTVNTDIGYLTLAICYDINFPDYLNQLSRLGLDTLLVPSWDWDGITDYHSYNLRIRAIENGFNTMKSTAHGITLSNDYKGRILSYYRPNFCEDHFVLSSLYKRGTKTLYSYIGKFFNYLYLITLIIVVIIGRCSMINENNKETNKLKIK